MKRAFAPEKMTGKSCEGEKPHQTTKMRKVKFGNLSWKPQNLILISNLEFDHENQNLKCSFFV